MLELNHKLEVLASASGPGGTGSNWDVAAQVSETRSSELAERLAATETWHLGAWQWSLRAEEQLVIACLLQETEREAFRKYLVDVQPVCPASFPVFDNQAASRFSPAAPATVHSYCPKIPGSCSIPVKPVLSLPVQCDEVQYCLPAPAGHMAGVLSQ